MQKLRINMMEFRLMGGDLQVLNVTLHNDYSSFMCNGCYLSPPPPPAAGDTRQCAAVEQNCLE